MNSRPLLRLWLLIARIGSLTYVSSIDGLRMVYSNDESGAQTGRGSTDGSNGVEVRSNLDTDDYDDNEWEAPITADRKYLELLSITIREDPIESRLGVDPAISPGVERRRLGEPSFETSVGDDVGRLLAATSAGGGSQHSGSRQQIERILVKSDGDPFKNAETWTDVFAQQDKPLESLAPQDEASATTTKMTSILSRIAAFFSGNRAQTDDDGYEEEKQSEDTEEGVHEVGDEPEDNPDDEISNGLDGVEDDNGNFTLDGDDSTARRCFKHPQCLGMLNAFDPFKLPWGMAGHIYPDRPRTDPDFTEESATLPEMRSCLLEKNTECRAEHAGRICYTLQTKFFASKLINAMRGISNKCLHFLVKKQAPAPGNRYKTCAVIANGPGYHTSMNKSSVIDSYHAVFRSNLFPFEFSQGFNTTWRTLNKKRLDVVLHQGKGRQFFAPHLPATVQYRGYTLIPNADKFKPQPKKKKSKSKRRGDVLANLAKGLAAKTNTGVMEVAPTCREKIDTLAGKVIALMKGWKIAPKGSKDELSSGIINLFLAFGMCEDVDIYGFGTHAPNGGLSKSLLVSDRMSRFHDWGMEQAMIRFFVTSGMVDLC